MADKKKTPTDDAALAALFRNQGRPRGKRKLSATERKLWTQVTESVEPLGDRPAMNKGDRPAMNEGDRPDPPPVSPVIAPPAPPRPVPAKAARPKAAPVALPPAPAVVHRPDKTELGHGATPGIDKNTAGKFKKGRMAIEGRLDLHGHSQRDAHVSVKSFIANAYAAEKRCVLIVTGKGKRGYDRDGAVGVLRQSVPRWLNEPGLRGKILSFSYATPADGGEGALYVLLKRRRGD